MAESIKQRMGQNKLGKMSNYALLKLLNATRADLASVYAVLNNVTNDANNVQVVLNNLGSAVGNLQVTANNLVNDVVKLSNNTNSANNTVQITAVAATTNINAATIKGGTAPVAQTLVA